MTPSEIKQMTQGQIDKAVASYRALLEKHAGEFNSEAVQRVLGQPELANEQFSIFRKRVEIISNFIIRKVKVDRKRTPKQSLDATGRVQYMNQKVVDEMPKGEGEEVEVYLIPFKKILTESELEQEVEKLGFKLVDPITLCALNEQDPSLTDTTPNGTQWRDRNGTACFVTFDHWPGRGVGVFQSDSGWGDFWFFGCVRKKRAEVSGS